MLPLAFAVPLAILPSLTLLAVLVRMAGPARTAA